MFSHLIKRENEKRGFFANLFGTELKDSSSIDHIKYDGDPATVAHLSEEEKEKLTQRLMAQHQAKFKEFNLNIGGGK